MRCRRSSTSCAGTSTKAPPQHPGAMRRRDSTTRRAMTRPNPEPPRTTGRTFKLVRQPELDRIPDSPRPPSGRHASESRRPRQGRRESGATPSASRAGTRDPWLSRRKYPEAGPLPPRPSPLRVRSRGSVRKCSEAGPLPLRVRQREGGSSRQWPRLRGLRSASCTCLHRPMARLGRPAIPASNVPLSMKPSLARSRGCGRLPAGPAGSRETSSDSRSAFSRTRSFSVPYGRRSKRGRRRIGHGAITWHARSPTTNRLPPTTFAIVPWISATCAGGSGRRSRAMRISTRCPGSASWSWTS